jgi:ribonuclease P protein component
MIGRLVQTADFQRLLATPPRWRSAHFAVHHLQEAPSMRVRQPLAGGSMAQKLSTGGELIHPHTVDECDLPALAVKPLGERWLGCVVPKRQAKRAVTRNLIKRQVRAAAQRLEDRLPVGLWLVRLRQGFPLAEFPSAASTSLRLALRRELDRLFTQAMGSSQRPASQPRTARQSAAREPAADASTAVASPVMIRPRVTT